MKKPALAQAAYAAMAAEYARLIDTKPHNAYYERQATLSLLPPLAGLHVLDAGCGTGVYSELLLEQGAEVTALDASAEMLAYARTRIGERVIFHQANLEEPLDFLQPDSFDLVVAPLVLDYVADWDALFQEFWRLLRPRGSVVWSFEHPAFSLERAADYFQREQLETPWRSFGNVPVPHYRRSLSDAINPALRAGFVLDGLVEPRPTAEFERADPAGAAKLHAFPCFLCLRVCKHS